MDGLSPTAVITRNDEIVTADMDGETVMMSIENGRYYNLGKMGTVIWALLEKPLTLDALVEKLTSAYDVSRAQCEAEVRAFLADMQNEALITVR